MSLQKIFAAGLLFLLFSHVFFFMTRPVDDWNFYLGKPATSAFTTGEGTEHNELVQVSDAQLDLETLRVQRSALFDITEGFFFQLKNQTQSRVFFYVDQGPLFDELMELTTVDEKHAAESLVPLPHSDELAALRVNVLGRAHRSDRSIMTPFMTIPEHDDIDFDDYVRTVLDSDLKTTPHWLVYAGDVPGAENFTESNGMVFCLGLLIGLIALALLLAHRTHQRKQKEEEALNAPFQAPTTR
ncbi:MAG: hypothetical protein MK135_16875 [Polyangiaceae bacterium]|nr:hypothetical protein [Polyangiaceae bacterium]